ncbi:TetR/AcrR family transcriptional regulator [Tropicimonas sp. TH_r6]|uniref:TetR/AcrR family transcriptional regulator n=1 Tax=Tropicimonas sp. TH_r6 TaxID=3082085 RepID=UPI002952EA8A|nr:TetR/AcrR family transcriptional regulator [Tropicimonas sp. TH_r6]MDV7142456.1 TetR/AcrR family transcriptional regulator [Tropicimonas sp. TH_r6]
MLQKVYLEVKTEFHERVTASRNAPESATMIRQMWFDMFDFVAAQPRDFLFLEYGSAAKILTPEQQSIADGFAEDIAALLKRGADDGTLAPLEPRILSLLLVAPAMQLARSAVLSGKDIPRDMVEQTFDRVWRAIAAN